MSGQLPYGSRPVIPDNAQDLCHLISSRIASRQGGGDCVRTPSSPRLRSPSHRFTRVRGPSPSPPRPRSPGPFQRAYYQGSSSPGLFSHAYYRGGSHSSPVSSSICRLGVTRILESPVLIAVDMSVLLKNPYLLKLS